MPFANEQDIRNEALLYNTETVPAEQLLQCLAMAHYEILNETQLTEDSVPSWKVIRAESILAIAYFLRSLAVSSSVTAEHWKTGTIQVNGYEKIRSLMDMSQKLREEATILLQAYRRIAIEPAILAVRRDEP